MSELLNYIDRIHTTTLGIERIKRNLSIEVDDVVAWSIQKIIDSSCEIERKGKNYYARIDNIIFCINAHSFTIITAHKCKK